MTDEQVRVECLRLAFELKALAYTETEYGPDVDILMAAAAYYGFVHDPNLHQKGLDELAKLAAIVPDPPKRRGRPPKSKGNGNAAESH